MTADKPMTAETKAILEIYSKLGPKEKVVFRENIVISSRISAMMLTLASGAEKAGDKT